MNNSNVKNLLSKNLFVVCFIFLFAGELKAEETKLDGTALERLWELVVFENTEVRAAIRDKELLDYDFNHYWKRFLPSVSFSSSSTFSDISTENAAIPEALNSCITISENLPGGLSIDVSPNVSFSREISANKVKLIDETKMSISISQRLLPYWAQQTTKKGIKRKNPEKIIQELNNKKATVNSKMVFLAVLEDITGKYIQYRICCRNIDCVEKRIALTEKKLETLKKLKLVGEASLIQVFSMEEELKNYMSELQAYKSSKESILFSITKSLPIQNDYYSLNYLQELLLANKALPEEIESVFLENPTYEYLKLQEQNLDTNLILSKQNSSPVFSLNGSIPLHNGYDESDFVGAYQSSNAKKWSVSLSLNLTPLTANSKKRILLEYANDKKTNEEKMEALLYGLAAEREMYKTLLADSEKQLELSKKNLEYYSTLLAAQKELFDKGQINALELYQTESEIECKKNDIQNCEDNIWYYSWIIKNRLLGQARQ